jgi:dUTP pyrophosphatase
MLVAFNKSGVATKRNLTVGACVVDEDYQGEIHIHLTNVGTETQEIKAGEKIVQFLLMPIVYEGLEEVLSEDELWEGKVTERGEGGFGSTGVN